ncbi:MAG: sigma 54-interacting transcriptional regulator [Candidatus Eiseniibacteriota bacterium]|nr:MAG: sigma 54-interacting transcriptional regulator [Candidatus Eisenbacteria bacterium]
MAFGIPDIKRIEKRLETLRNISAASEYLERLEVLADLYLNQDGYEPALEYLEEILSKAHRMHISDAKRIRLEMKVIECLLRRSRCGEALEKCGDIARELSAQRDEKVSAELNLLLSQVHWKMGDYGRAIASCQEALRTFARHREDRKVAQCHNCMGKSYLRLGQAGVAREQFEEALAVYRRLKEKAGIAISHNNLALLHKNHGEWQLAFDHLNKALELDKESGNYGKIALRLLNIGLVYHRTGRWREARVSLEEALSIARRIGDRHTCAAASIGLGNALRLLGETAAAERLYSEAILVAEKENLAREIALAHEFMGESELARGSVQSALDRFQQALAIAEKIASEGDIVAEVERRRAEVFLECGEHKQALKSSRRALKLSSALGDRHEEGAALCVLARIKADAGCRRSAGVAFRASVKRLQAVRDRYGLARTLLHFGRFLCGPSCSGDDKREGRRLLARAAGIFAELGAERLLQETEKELEEAWGAPGRVTPAPRPDEDSAQRENSSHGFVTCDVDLLGVIRTAEKLCSSDTRVLIQGETGIGKNLLAYVFKTHEEQKGGSFVELNCAAIPGELLESELFGYAKGAFSGAVGDKKGILEEANGGTLFLNEIGEMDPRMQAKLLQVLDDGWYRRVGDTGVRRLRSRIISATNKDLWLDVEKRAFRRDLYFRLAQAVLVLHPLRDRKKDVALLARHFLEMYCHQYSKHVSLDSSALDSLEHHNWPGNVRELRSKIQLLVIDSPRAATLSARDVARVLDSPDERPEPRTLAEKIEWLKRAEITRALGRFGGNKTRAAQALGISRRGLLKVMERM